MQFIKLTEKQAVPIEQIQYIKAAGLSMENLYGYKAEVTVLRPDGRIAEYYSAKTISELVDEINNHKEENTVNHVELMKMEGVNDGNSMG